MADNNASTSAWSMDAEEDTTSTTEAPPTIPQTLLILPNSHFPDAESLISTTGEPLPVYMVDGVLSGEHRGVDVIDVKISTITVDDKEITVVDVTSVILCGDGDSMEANCSGESEKFDDEDEIGHIENNYNVLALTVLDTSFDITSQQVMIVPKTEQTEDTD